MSDSTEDAGNWSPCSGRKSGIHFIDLDRDDLRRGRGAKGEGLWIALDCAGTVTVDDSGGMSSTFQCTSDDVLSYTNHDNQAHGASTVSVSTTGDVVWGLTISSAPLTV